MTEITDQSPIFFVGVALLGIGFLIALVYTIVLLVKAFQTSVGWGLVCLLTGVGTLVFIVVHWNVAGKPFLKNLGGALLGGVGAAVMTMGAGGDLIERSEGGGAAPKPAQEQHAPAKR